MEMRLKAWHYGLRRSWRYAVFVVAYNFLMTWYPTAFTLYINRDLGLLDEPEKAAQYYSIIYTFFVYKFVLALASDFLALKLVVTRRAQGATAAILIAVCFGSYYWVGSYESLLAVGCVRTFFDAWLACVFDGLAVTLSMNIAERRQDWSPTEAHAVGQSLYRSCCYLGMFLAYAGNMTVLTYINYKIVLIITGVGYCALGVAVAVSTHFEETDAASLRPATSMKTRERLSIAGQHAKAIWPWPLYLFLRGLAPTSTTVFWSWLVSLEFPIVLYPTISLLGVIGLQLGVLINGFTFGSIRVMFFVWMFVAVGVSFVLEMGSYYWATAASTAGAAAIVVLKEFLSSLVNQAAYIGVLILMSRLSSQHLPSFSFNVFVSIENFGEWIQGFLNMVIIKHMDIGPDFSKLPVLHCICQASRLVPLLVLLASGSLFWSYIEHGSGSKDETDIEAEMTSNPLSSLSTSCTERLSLYLAGKSVRDFEMPHPCVAFDPCVAFEQVRAFAQSGVVSSTLTVISEKDSMADEDCGIGEGCGICFQDLQGERGELCALSPCGHVWHSKCIVDWFQKSPGSTCPLCRKAGTLVELLLKIDYRGLKKQVNTKTAEMSKTKSQLKKTEKALKETVRILGAREKKLSKKQDEIKRLHARCGNLADGKKAAESKLQQQEATEKVNELRRRVRLFNHDQACQPPKHKKSPVIAKLRRSARLRRVAMLHGGSGD